MSLPRLSTGIPGLDEILMGGLIPGRAYMVTGGPGCGKTMLGLHFLAAGATRNERTLMITLDEPEAQIRQNAAGVGLDLKAVEILDLSPGPEAFAEEQSYDLFPSSEVESDPIARKIIGRVETLAPVRVFLDAMTQFRYLSTDAYQFRKQVLSLLRYLTRRGATVLFSSEAGPNAPDNDLQFMSDGILRMGFSSEEGRRLTVGKFRGSGFQKGDHALRLTPSGAIVFPRLMPGEHRQTFTAEPVPSGVSDLDKLLHGGLERGTVTIISGPSGAGKTSLGLQFMKQAASRGEYSVLFAFEESAHTLIHRSEGIGIPISRMVEQGTLSVVNVEPLRSAPDEFAALVRRQVETQRARILMIDGTAGYGLSFGQENPAPHLHALCKYLKNMGVTVLLIHELESITGEFRATEMGISYVADNIIFLRYVEIDGRLEKAIGVLKKRLSDFEKTLCQFSITSEGLSVGPPLVNLRGILRGAPGWMTS